MTKEPREGPTLQDAIAFQKAGDLTRAETIYRELLLTEADQGHIWHRLGILQQQQGGLPSAIAALEEAIRLDPHDEAAKKNLLTYLHKAAYESSAQNRVDDAKAYYRRCLSLHPADAGALNNLAQLLHHTGDEAEALPFYDRAVALSPQNPLVTFNRSICRLAEGRLAEGWLDLEASRKAWLPHMDDRAHLPWTARPLWMGQPLKGKRIVIWGDQGIGDEILYAGMIGDLTALGAEITVECAKPLAPLFKRSFPALTILPRETPSQCGQDFDYHAPGLWLGRWLRYSLASFPNRKSYLHADRATVARLDLGYRTAQGKRPKRIGLAWTSRVAGFAESRRISLDALTQTLPTEPLYIDLQYGDTAAERAKLATDRPAIALHHDDNLDPLNDIDRLAAQVASCDAIITIGTTVAHLAGALGIPALVLLPRAGRTWYWFQARTDSPWYPSLHLSRKTSEPLWQNARSAVPDFIQSIMGRTPESF